MPVKSYHVDHQAASGDLLSEESILIGSVLERLKIKVKQDWSALKEDNRRNYYDLDLLDPVEFLICEKYENELKSLLGEGLEMQISFWMELYKQEQSMFEILSISRKLEADMAKVRAIEKQLDNLDPLMTPFISRIRVNVDLYVYLVYNDFYHGLKFSHSQGAFDRFPIKRKVLLD